MANPKTLGRLIKWITELSEYGIQYLPHTTIKAKELVDFLAESVGETKNEVWKTFVDESSTEQGSGVGVLLLSPQGEEILVVIWLNFKASNNESEYEALLVGLQAAKYVGASKVDLHSDSQLAAQQVEGLYEVKKMKDFINIFICIIS